MYIIKKGEDLENIKMWRIPFLLTTGYFNLVIDIWELKSYYIETQLDEVSTNTKWADYASLKPTIFKITYYDMKYLLF